MTHTPARRALGLLLVLVLAAGLFCALALALPTAARAADYEDGHIFDTGGTVTCAGKSFAGTITIAAGTTLTLRDGCTAAAGTRFVGAGNLKLLSYTTALTANGSLTLGVTGALTLDATGTPSNLLNAASHEVTIQDSGTVRIIGNNNNAIGCQSLRFVRCPDVEIVSPASTCLVHCVDCTFEEGSSATIKGDCPYGVLEADRLAITGGSAVTAQLGNLNLGSAISLNESLLLDGGSLSVKCSSSATTAAGLAFVYPTDPGPDGRVVPITCGPGGAQLSLGPQAMRVRVGTAWQPDPRARLSRRQNNQPWQLAGPAAGDYTIDPAASPLELAMPASGQLTITLPPVPGPTPGPAPGADPSLDAATGLAPDFESAEYYARHYNYWLGALTQLNALGHSGTVTMDTHGHGIDHIQHFVFDALVGTRRTLVVRHRGEVYTIRGRAESAGGKMGGIALGHNHSFDILGAYKTSSASSTQRG